MTGKRGKKSIKIEVSICIPAYNEEQNIGKLLASLLNQKLSEIEIKQICVVASGCTDKTVEIVKKINPKIDLIIQHAREGKASAINEFLKKTKTKICVIIGADTLPEKDTIEKLCSPFKDSKIGMTGGHPIPVNNSNDFIGYCIKTLWQLHHELSLSNPKCGEIIAFRKIFNTIPENSPVDEASIEEQIFSHKLKIIYVRDAIVHNKGPETIGEFMAQRRRINAGHLWLKKKYNYKVSTTSYLQILKLTIKKTDLNFKKNVFLACLILVELSSKILAYYDYYILRKNYTIWPQIKSSKNP